MDSRTSVTDVKFGPKHLGLLLVTCSADGIIRYDGGYVIVLFKLSPNYNSNKYFPISQWLVNTR